MLPNVGSILAKNLIAYCGSAETVFKTSKSKLLKIPMVGEERAEAIVKSDVLKDAEKEVRFIKDYKIKPLFFTDEEFPYRLKECADGPVMLYYKGNANLNAGKVIGIVGTRKCTNYGKEATKNLVRDLASQDVLILSGLAYGIDIAAHNASLEFGLPTVGVLGHSLNMIYPEEHKSSAKKMVEHGGLLTEFKTSDKFTQHNFPTRNRVVAGMCDAVVVVESGIKGGAVITANIANSYNRDVFAYPGKTKDKSSAGCNFLIKTFKAALIENADDLVQAMNWDTKQAKPKQQTQLALNLSEDETKVYKILSDKPEVEIDELTNVSGLSSSSLAATLLEMEMNGLVLSLPGKRYKLT
jgi:DNA processing protein